MFYNSNVLCRTEGPVQQQEDQDILGAVRQRLRLLAGAGPAGCPQDW